jgi:hypothetical protein
MLMPPTPEPRQDVVAPSLTPNDLREPVPPVELFQLKLLEGKLVDLILG